MRVLLAAASATILAAGDAHAAGPIRPTIQLEMVPNDRYAPQANMIVRGRITVLTDTNVSIRAHHVLPDDGFVPLGGVDLPINPDGTFQASLYPASPGWRPGTLRIVASIGAMNHIKTSCDVTIAEPDAPQKEWVGREPASSGITINLDDRPTGIEVAQGQTFLVRGSTKLEAPPFLLLQIFRTDNPEREVIYSSAFANYLLHGDDRRWFEVQLKSPKDEGTYELRAFVNGKPKEEVLRIPVRPQKPLALGPGAPAAPLLLSQDDTLNLPQEAGLR